MPTTNKHFVGNLPQLQLSAILLSTVTTGGTFGTTGTVTGWPDGTGTRSFVVGIGTYGQTGYEEILCSLRGAGVFTVEQRGYDNTSVVQHASGDPVTLVVDAGTIDAHELYVFQNTRRDVLANRGSAATYVDTNFYATDVRVLYRSDGTNWQPIGMASGVYTTAQRDALVAAEVYTGRMIWNTTTGQAEMYTGAAWVAVPVGTALLKASNLSDLASASSARTNLGLAAIAASGSAADLGSGTVPTARLGSGAASSSTYLRGDQTWATVAGGGIALDHTQAYMSVDQALSTGTETKLLLGAEDFDTSNQHSVASATGDMVIATTGVYEIDGVVQWDSSTAGTQRYARIKQNSTIIYQGTQGPQAYASNVIPPFSLSLTAGDVVAVFGGHDKGSNMSVLSNASVQRATFLRLKRLS